VRSGGSDEHAQSRRGQARIKRERLEHPVDPVFQSAGNAFETSRSHCGTAKHALGLRTRQSRCSERAWSINN
jgi:hypothetical protein